MNWESTPLLLDILKELQVPATFYVLASTGSQSNMVLLMHDSPCKSLTRESLPSIVQKLSDECFQFATIY